LDVPLYDKGKYFWVQYHFKTDQGIKNLTREEPKRISGKDRDHATRDLYEAIERGDYPSWTLEMQILTPAARLSIRIVFCVAFNYSTKRAN
jgi:catalase